MDSEYRKVDPEYAFQKVRVYRDGHFYYEGSGRFLNPHSNTIHLHENGKVITKSCDFLYGACYRAPWRDGNVNCAFKSMDKMGFPMYIALEDGNIFSKYTMRNITPMLDKRGYARCILRDKNDKRVCLKIHRVIATMFISNPLHKPQVNHIDGDRLNNHASNLEWVTNDENQYHRTITETIATSLSRQQAIEVMERYCNGESCAELARYFKVGYGEINAIVTGEIHSDVFDNFKHIERKPYKRKVVDLVVGKGVGDQRRRSAPTQR